MEVLETRESELRRRVVGSDVQQRSASVTAHSIIDRLKSTNKQLEQLSAAIGGFAKLAEQYNANRELLQLHRGSATHSGEDLKRAIILSSEDHIAGVVNEFKKLHELQRYTTQLEHIHSNSAYAQTHVQSIETTHTLQEERALVFHARVEKLLGVYQQMIQILSEKCVEYNAVLERLLPATA